MDIVFCVPSFKKDEFIISLGPLILASILEKSNITSKLISYNQTGFFDKDVETFVDDYTNLILADSPKIVSLFLVADITLVQLKIADTLKLKNPEIIIIAGGPQATTLGKKLFEFCNSLDYICCGEGESTITPLCSSLLNNAIDLSIPGLIYKDNNIIIENSLPACLQNDYVIPIDIYSHLEQLPENILKDGATFSLDAGRGCVGQCTFCAVGAIWRHKPRHRNLDNIIDTIKLVKEKYGVSTFALKSYANFLSDKQFVIDFCKRLITENLNIKWSCSARINDATPELLELMHSAGLDGIFYGVESGSTKIQKSINKYVNLDKVFSIVDYSCKQLSYVNIGLIYNFPNESLEDFIQTLNLIYQLSKYPTDIIANRLLFFYGTPLYQQYQDQLYFKADNGVYKYDFLTQTNLKQIDSKGDYSSLVPSCYVGPTQLPEIVQYIDIFIVFVQFFKNTTDVLLDYFKQDIWQLYNFIINNSQAKKLWEDYIINYDKQQDNMHMYIIEKFSIIIQNSSLPEYIKDIFDYDIALYKLKTGELKSYQKSVNFNYKALKVKDFTNLIGNSTIVLDIVNDRIQGRIK